MSEVECKSCHRIDFEEHQFCTNCHWQIRAMELEGPVYGYDVLIEVFCANNFLTETVRKHFKGTESRCRSAAKRHHKFKAVLEMWPVGEATYLRAYGDPTRRM